MTTEPSQTTEEPRPFYDPIASVNKTMAAGELGGLNEELRSLRAYVFEYAKDHKGEFDKVLKGMRLIMQMVLAQHRMSAGQLAEAQAALEAATREFREAFLAPEVDDV